MASPRPLRSPALWTLVALSVASAVWLTTRLFRSGVGPGPASAVLLSWVCYAAILTAIVVKLARDARPPASVVVGSALWGGLAAAASAQLIASATRDEIADALGSSGEAWTSALAAPLPEEILKAAGVLLLCLAWADLRNPLSGMVLGAVAGIAFNAAEGLAYSITEIADTGGSLEPLWSDLLVRGFLTGLITHAGLTAVVGAGIGYLLSGPETALMRRVVVFITLLFLAVALHALIDSPLLDAWGIRGIVAKQIPVAALAWLSWSRSQSELTRRRRLNRH